MASEEDMINSFTTATNTAGWIPFPPSFFKIRSNLQSVIRHLPKKEFDF